MIWCVLFQNNTIYEELEESGDEELSEDNYDSDATTIDENDEDNNTGAVIGVDGEGKVIDRKSTRLNSSHRR